MNASFSFFFFIFLIFFACVECSFSSVIFLNSCHCLYLLHAIIITSVPHALLWAVSFSMFPSFIPFGMFPHSLALSRLHWKLTHRSNSWINTLQHFCMYRKWLVLYYVFCLLHSRYYPHFFFLFFSTSSLTCAIHSWSQVYQWYHWTKPLKWIKCQHEWVTTWRSSVMSPAPQHLP